MTSTRLLRLLATCFLVLAVVPNESNGQQAGQMTSPDTAIDYGQRELYASPAIRNQLETLRSIGTEKGWTFEVGYTTAMDYTIETITGLKVPDDLLQRMIDQNESLEKDEPLQRLLCEIAEEPLTACAATAKSFSSSRASVT